MKVLIIGANGLLGSELYNHFLNREGFSTYGTYNQNYRSNHFWKVDVTDLESIRGLTRVLMPQIVINASAISNVDMCETNKKLAHKINVKGLENIIKCCKGKLVHFSTDYVFDGKKGNYKENDETNPLNYYGKTKLIGENLVKKGLEDHLILRVAVLYGRGRENFITYAIKNLQQGKKVKAVKKQIITPTYTKDVALATQKLLSERGIFHVCGADSLSRVETAHAICEEFNLNKKLVKKVKSVGWVAKRPQNTSLNTEKIKSLGIRMSTFKQGLKKLREEILK